MNHLDPILAPEIFTDSEIFADYPKIGKIYSAAPINP